MTIEMFPWVVMNVIRRVAIIPEGTDQTINAGLRGNDVFRQDGV